MRPSTDAMCPSTTAANATVLLGMITPAGTVAYVTPMTPPSVATELVGDGEQPEASFRFAGPCITTGCGFWSESRCGLGARLVESYEDSTVATTETPQLPRCAIRPSCRWYAEHGPRACAACPWVVTDNRGRVTT
jgi:hypothetical protein